MPKFNLYQSLHTTVVGPAGQAARGADPHPGDAPAGPSTAWPPTGPTRTTSCRPTDMAWLNRIVDWQSETDDPTSSWRSSRSTSSRTRSSSSRPRARSSPCPTGATPIDFAYAIHTEVGHACIGARVNGRLAAARLAAAVGRHRRDLHLQGRGRGPVAGLAEDRRHAPGPQQDPPVVLPGAPRGRHRDRPRRADQGAAPRGPAGAEAAQQADVSADVAAKLSYADLDALYVAIGENHVSAKSVAAARRPRRCASGDGRGAAARSPARAPRRRRKPTVRRARRGPRRRHGAAVALLHAGAGRRDHGLRHPGPRRVGAPHRLRQRRVAGRRAGRPAHRRRVGRDEGSGTFVVSIEVKALDRARLLRDVSAALADHHVNILACATQTGADRISRMRFDFELADPSPPRLAHRHASASIDSVYDAYRVLPGKGG